MFSQTMHIAFSVGISVIGVNSSVTHAQYPLLPDLGTEPAVRPLVDGKEQSAFTIDGKWDTHAGRGVVTIRGNNVTDKDGNVGKVKYGDGRVNIFWPDNTGEGSLHVDPKNPDVLKGQGKYGHKWIWNRVK